MEIIFRTDSSKSIGSGHVARSLNLADELRKRGANITFFTQRKVGNINSVIKNRGFLIKEIDHKNERTFKKNTHIDIYEKWLGVSEEEDAYETLKIINNKKIDWMIVDHYSLSKKWEKIVKPNVDKILVIDDLANREHFCDIIIDQNWYPNQSIRYNKLVPKNCKKL